MMRERRRKKIVVDSSSPPSPPLRTCLFLNFSLSLVQTSFPPPSRRWMLNVELFSHLFNRARQSREEHWKTLETRLIIQNANFNYVIRNLFWMKQPKSREHSSSWRCCCVLSAELKKWKVHKWALSWHQTDNVMRRWGGIFSRLLMIF